MIQLHIQQLGGLWCGVAIQESQVVATAFAFDKEDGLHRLLNQLPPNVSYQVLAKKNVFADKVSKVIKAVFDGEDTSFCIPLAMTRLSKYAQGVLRLTSIIPVGYVATYGSLAEISGGSPRSIGRVMASNPFAPLVPCHRVVTANMTLGGYGFGLETKWRILQRESRGYAKTLTISCEGEKLSLHPGEMVKPWRPGNAEHLNASFVRDALCREDYM